MKKTCKHCGDEFEPFRPMQTVCGPLCASRWVRSEKKKERSETKARKEAAKPRSKWLAECQQIVNKYVRLKAFRNDERCYTCGSRPAQKAGGTMDAGHFRSVGSAPHLRFWLPQIRVQCIVCNRHKGGVALLFRQALVKEHGNEWVEELEARHEVAKYSIDYLRRLKDVMSRKVKRLEKRLQ